MSTTTFMIRRISREDDELKQLHATAIKCKEHIQQYYAGKGGIGGGNDVLPVECHEFLPHYSREKDATPKQVVLRRRQTRQVDGPLTSDGQGESCSVGVEQK